MYDVLFNTVLKLLSQMVRHAPSIRIRRSATSLASAFSAMRIGASSALKNKDASPEKKAEGWGDLWTWVAIARDTKLVSSFMIGTRGASSAKAFMNFLASRLANRVQLTTDGHRVYLQAIESAFGANVDYAMLVKLYGR